MLSPCLLEGVHRLVKRFFVSLAVLLLLVNLIDALTELVILFIATLLCLRALPQNVACVGILPLLPLDFLLKEVLATVGLDELEFSLHILLAGLLTLHFVYL